MKAGKAKHAVTFAALLYIALLCLKGYYSYAAVYERGLSIKVSAVAQWSGDGVSWTARDLEDIKAIPDGARLQINFRPATPCYAYLLHTGTDVTSSLLYNRDRESGTLTPGETYTLPSPDLWYTARDMALDEELHLIVSGRPLNKEQIIALHKKTAKGTKSDTLAVPLSDGGLFKTRWREYHGRGFLSITWALK